MGIAMMQHALLKHVYLRPVSRLYNRPTDVKGTLIIN